MNTPVLSASLRRVVTLTLLAVGAIAVVGHAPAAFAQVSKLGVMGDSLADEYSEETYKYAKNWTMQLVLYRGVNLGPTAAAAGQAGGTWGEPRRTGYQFNWARYGADSGTLLTQGQHTGVAAQAAANGVTHAVLAIGANDFSPGITGAYFNIYNNLWSAATITNYVNSRIANIQTAVNTVSASGERLVICTLPDYGVAPATWMSFFFNNATKRERVSAVIRRVNDGVRAVAQVQHTPLVDLYALSVAIFGPNGTPRQFLKIGNQDIQLWNSDTTTNTNPYAGFVDDGAHPHTTLQGGFANVMIAALNLYGAGITPFSEAEVLAHAGIPYGGSDTVVAQIGTFEHFVENYICRADYDKNGFVSGEDFDLFVVDFQAGDISADFNADGFVTGDDFDEFAAAFEAGC